jgi:hypothetical protein
MLNFSVGFHQDVATVNFHLVQQALKASGSPKPPDKRLRFGPVSVWNRAQPARLRTAEMAAVLLRLPASCPAPRHQRVWRAETPLSIGPLSKRRRYPPDASRREAPLRINLLGGVFFASCGVGVADVLFRPRGNSYYGARFYPRSVPTNSWRSP